MIKNLNPLFEARFLSGWDPEAGRKLFKNGVKKNGFLTTLNRNAEAAVKRGKHKVKLMGSPLAYSKSRSDRKFFSSVGKKAAKDQHISSKEAKAIKKGNTEIW